MSSIFTRTATVVACALPVSAAADQVFNESVIVTDSLLCVGLLCADMEPAIPGRDGIMIKDAAPAILFDDTSPATNPDRDWRIAANEIGMGIEGLFFNDITEGTTPFTIEGGAPDNALYVRASGNVGIGTVFPTANLDIRSGNTPAIVLNQTTELGEPSQIWRLSANETVLSVLDSTNVVTPFQIEPGAATASLFVASSGNIGLGTNTPQAPLEVSSDGTFNYFRISATGAAVNDSVDITFTGGPLGTGQLRYNIVDGDSQEMSLDADGNMVLDGTLTTAGPTCAGGCDRVFDADYPLPSIAEHTQHMLSAGHLPSIGATVPHAPINLSERQGKIINSLEHAHLYIADLHTQLAGERARNDDLEMRMLRLERNFGTPQDTTHPE